MNRTESADGKSYCFDDVVIDGENFCVRKGGRQISLTPRAFDVLTFLIRNNGRVLEKQEIFESVWKDTFVTDNALAKVIKEIRHALADPAEHPHYIETIPRRGYRFIGRVREEPAQTAAAAAPPIKKNDSPPIVVFDEREKTDEKIVRPAAAALPPPPRTIARRTAAAAAAPRFAVSKFGFAVSFIGLISIAAALAAWLVFRPNSAEEVHSPPIRSIAVLPFKPLDADSRDASLEMGMAEALITRLSNLRQVAVRPMSAVRAYADSDQDSIKAGRSLKVEAVLEGSIQKAGERVRVTVRLINVAGSDGGGGGGAPLWSEQFDENFTDIFNVQDSIAERVSSALALQLSKQERERLGRHPTENAEAYQLYLRGQLLWHRRQPNWTEQSLEHYRQALEKDPNFALAYIGAADAYITLSGQRKVPTAEAEAKARFNITKALEIDDTSALAHNALAELKYQYEYDWAGAEREFKTALELNPNVAWIHQAYGWFLMSQGRFDESAFEMDRAGELDPNSLTINTGRGRLYYYSRQYDRAIRHFQNIIAVEPNEGSAHFSLFNIYEQNRMYEQALEIQLKMMSRNGAPPEVLEEFRETFRVSGWEGCLRKRLEFAERRVKQGKVEPYGLAHLYVRLGDKDKAFEYLEKIFELRDPTIVQFKIEPAYDSLRGDPRYDRLVRKIGLQP